MPSTFMSFFSSSENECQKNGCWLHTGGPRPSAGHLQTQEKFTKEEKTPVQ